MSDAHSDMDEADRRAAERSKRAETRSGTSLSDQLRGSLALENEEAQDPREVQFEEMAARHAKLHRTVTRMTAEHAGLQCLISELEEKAKLLEMVPPFLREASELNYRKSQDYGTEGDLSKRKYHPFGAVSYLHMLHLKLVRLTSVLGQDDAPNFESARDSLLDLANYVAFFGAYLDEEAAAEEARHLMEWAAAAEEELHPTEI